MKRYNFSKIFADLGRLLMVLTFLAGVSACDNVIYNYGDDCDPEQENPVPTPDLVKIYVRSNPGGGGMSQVDDVVNAENSAQTEEGIYVSIDIAKDGTYTLTATETNPEYEFVRWHDDTFDGDLTEGMKVISNIKAEGSNKYTAVFRKIEDPEPEPEPGLVRIYVRTNPGSGGTSRVHEAADEKNAAETTEGIYTNIDIEENGLYTLTAVESNSEYEFVRWHDDTNESDLTEGEMVISDIKAESSNRYTAIFRKIEVEEPEPEPEPGIVRISVRTNPGGGGTSRVHEADNAKNMTETEEGIYTSIELEENGTYTLTATESNPDYVFVKWHDDTNEIDLTEGKKTIPNIKAETSAKYTAVFRKIEEPKEPEYVKIFVRSNPGSGGTSRVHEVANAKNMAETDGGIYETIDIEVDGTYTLTAIESNSEYEFVRWHDDTNESDLTEGMKVISNIKAVASNRYTAIFRKIEIQEPEPEPEPGIVRISVRTNPGGGGTSRVHEVAKPSNNTQTEEGIYTSIELEENGTYTLTATESNSDYVFVKWHDDTNDIDLSEGKMVIADIKAEASARYTAIFRKIEEPKEPNRVKIFVRANPSGGGTGKVHDTADASNLAETDGGIYVGIDVEEGGTYTLTATESNKEYEFVKWHDDTNDTDLTEDVKVIPEIKAVASARYTAIFRKIEIQEPEPEPSIVRISVRTNPGGGGTSQVHETDDPSNSTQTEEGIYTSIDLEENGTYTLTATESNPDYVFVKWHDDTNDIDLSEGKMVIADIKAEASAKYTAIFRKIEEPKEPNRVKIFVKANPSGGGTSRVHEVANAKNMAETDSGIYETIDIEVDGTYTLTAIESNSEYEFVRWHDDTNDSDLTDGAKVIPNIKAVASNRYTAIFRKIEVQEPEPEPEPSIVRISVRTNPGGGGTSRVHETDDPSNSTQTQEGIYTYIELEENGTYTLTATESNPDYEFVRWHDDTNDGDLTDGAKVISNIKAVESTRYTAIFRKIEEPKEPEYVKIFVRSNPGSGGTSRVHEVANAKNMAETNGGIYETIDIEVDGTYTLTAIESNSEYEFVRWHDDTNDSDLTDGAKVIPNIKAVASNRYTAIFRKIEIQEPEPEPEPNIVRISVRTNPGGGGTSRVHEAATPSNSAQTQEGIYTYIELEENGTYTLTATESNPDYEFVRWHDDTNDGDLTDGAKVISNIKAVESTRYTAIFQKIGQTEPSDPTDPTPQPPTTKEGYYVKFVFDRNMQYADAFSNRVKSVDLYVFNTSGAFVTKYHEEVSKMTDGMMELTNLAPGTYELVAWCGLTDNNAFTVPASVSFDYQTICTMSTSGGVQEKNMSPLFHGASGTSTVDDNRNSNYATFYEKTSQKQIHTVYLTKDTNNVMLTLQHRQGLTFSKDRFVVTMEDTNDVMQYTNAIAQTAKNVTYKPYRTDMGYTTGSAGETTGDFMLVEISTARLMAKNNPVIKVYDTEQKKTIFSIPLVTWALKLRSSNFGNMNDQEYLDREDNYNLMLWMDSDKNGDGWFGVQININDWHVVDDRTDIN